MSTAKITDFIMRAADKHPLNPALYFSINRYINYASMAVIIRHLSEQLRAAGITDGTRAAVIFPNCAQSLIAFYAATNTATAVMLSPDASKKELEKYLRITQAQAVLTSKELLPFLHEIAEKLKLPVFTLTADENNASLQKINTFAVENIKVKQLADTAAVFLTSGTVSDSKVVPLTHRNLMLPAQIYQKVHNVQPDEHIINLVALFHIYGVTSSVLVAAAAGCSVTFLEKFELPVFFKILQENKISWYAAGAAMQTAIAAYAEKTNAKAEDYFLRMIRSGGTALPVSVINSLKKHFHVSVLLGYGLTESAGLGTFQMTSPPPAGKEASSGLAPQGIELKIADDKRTFLPPFKVGQIVLKGASITAGYENRKNSDAFWQNGYFATGDLGYVDEDNYLFVMGRIDDIINKGGEKISPYEIERVLLSHPSVLDAVVFPMPHKTLGSLPIAAAVLKEGAAVSESSLKRFLQKKLSAGKIPARIVFVKRLPYNKAEKIKRSDMYEYMKKHSGEFFSIKEKNTLAGNAGFIRTEQTLLYIWQQLLHKDNIDMEENFFTLGGDSLSAVYLFAEIEKQFKIRFSPENIFLYGTIRELSELIYKKDKPGASFDFIVPLTRTAESKPSLFCLHPLNGDVFTYRRFSEKAGSFCTIYGIIFNLRSEKIQAPVTITELAELYAAEICRLQPHGPYYLLGYSVGGAIAYETARILKARGSQIGLLALLDTRFAFKEELVENVFGTLRKKMLREIKMLHKTSEQTQDELIAAKILRHAFINYKPADYEGKIFYFYADLIDHTDTPKTLKQLREHAEEVEVIHIHTSHEKLTDSPAIDEVVKYLKAFMKNA